MPATNLPSRILTAQDAQIMAQIHAHSFDRPWPALDMSVHIKTDICLGVGAPLAAFLIIRTSQDEAEVLTLATDKSMRRQGYGQVLLRAALAQLARIPIRTLFLEVAPIIAVKRAA